MAGTATGIYAQTVKTWAQTILPADTTAQKALVTGGTNGTRILAITIASNDTSAVYVNFTVTIGATTYALGNVTVAITAGMHATAATPAVDVLRHSNLPGLARDALGNSYIDLAAGAILNVNATSTVTSNKHVDVVAYGGDF